MRGVGEHVRKTIVLASVAFSNALMCGCVESALIERSIPPDYGAWRDPAPAVASEGGVWPGQTAGGSFLYFDRKARAVGDLVTVLVVESQSAKNEAKTDVSRKSSQGVNITSDVGLQSFIGKPFKWILKFLGFAPDTAPQPAGTALNVLEADAENSHEGDGKTERSGRITATVTCRVVDVLPGNVFHVRGRRSTVVNHEQQFVTVEGLVRQEDIGIDNTVASTSLAEANIAYDGVGVIDDKQRPGFAARALDWVYPF